MSRKLVTALTVTTVIATAAIAAPMSDAQAGHRFGRGLAVGVLGGVIGSALLAPRYYAPAPSYAYGGVRPWSRGWYRYCSARYRSFDPGSGTFLGYDGYRHFCR